MKETYDSQFQDWVKKEKEGISLLKSAGSLMYDKGVELVLFRKQLLEIGVSELMNYISYANNVVKRTNKVEIANLLATSMLSLNLSPSKIDIGLLTAEFIESHEDNPIKFLENKLDHIINPKENKNLAKDVVLFGFGRIGRLVARELIKQAGKGQQLSLIHI